MTCDTKLMGRGRWGSSGATHGSEGAAPTPTQDAAPALAQGSAEAGDRGGAGEVLEHSGAEEAGAVVADLGQDSRAGQLASAGADERGT